VTRFQQDSRLGADGVAGQATLDAIVAELYLQSNPVPEVSWTIKDADGVSYRRFHGHGFQFHPLAAFGALNVEANQRRVDAARRLAQALIARGERGAGGLVWEYSFPFGGPNRWTSGFSQAVAATALLRASELTGHPKIADAAAAAFRTIPRRYLHATNGGQWILEYSQSSLLILNAQIQSLLLISEYARTTGDPDAKAIAASMLAATRRHYRRSTSAAGRSTRSAAIGRPRHTTSTTSRCCAGSPR
jgi:hypothetical protein